MGEFRIIERMGKKEIVYDPTKEPVIIYNPVNVETGLRLLTQIGPESAEIIESMESGKEDIKNSGFSGAVAIDTTQVRSIVTRIDDIIQDVRNTEATIVDYSEGSNWTQAGLPWYHFKYNDTYYTSASAGLEQTEMRLEKLQGEYGELTRKKDSGEATGQEIERMRQLDSQIDTLEGQKEYLQEGAGKEERLIKNLRGMNVDEYFQSFLPYEVEKKSFYPEQIGEGHDEPQGVRSPVQSVSIDAIPIEEAINNPRNNPEQICKGHDELQGKIGQDGLSQSPEQTVSPAGNNGESSSEQPLFDGVIWQ